MLIDYGKNKIKNDFKKWTKISKKLELSFANPVIQLQFQNQTFQPKMITWSKKPKIKSFEFDANDEERFLL